MVFPPLRLVRCVLRCLLSGLVATLVPAVAIVAQAQGVVPGGIGYDVSWPQCGHSLPQDETQVAVVGINGGSPFTTNPCLAERVLWARRSSLSYDVYLNLNWPDAAGMSNAYNGPKGACGATDVVCLGYNYGWNAVASASGAAASAGAIATTWWLDVETGDHWSTQLMSDPSAVSPSPG